MKSVLDSESTKRAQLFQQSKANYLKARYGLFSFSGTLAVSKYSCVPERPLRRDASGKVVTEPKNFLVSPLRHGRWNSDLFNVSPSVSIGDPYRDSPKAYAQEHIRVCKMNKLHRKPFKCAGAPQQPKFQYSMQTPQKLPKKIKQVLSQACKKKPPKQATPQTQLSPSASFSEISDSKSRAQSIHQRAFKTTFSNELFDKNNYWSEGVSRNHPRIKKKAFQPFRFLGTKSSKCLSTICAFPEYIASPQEQKIEEKKGNPRPFKSVNSGFSVPSPSIAAMIKNIRVEYPVLRNFNV